MNKTETTTSMRAVSDGTPSNTTIKPEGQKMDIPKFNPNRSREEYEFGKDFIELYTQEAFLGTLCANITRVEDWNAPTAYIGFDHKTMGIIMGYNPEFMASLQEKQRAWVIKHEIYHLCLLHILDRGNVHKKLRTLSNIAADLAVNSLLGEENMFDACLMPGLYPKNCSDKETGDLIKNFPKLQSLEFYLETLRAFAKARAKKECPECAAEKKRKEEQGKTKKSNKLGNPNKKKDGSQPGGQQGQPGEKGEKGENSQGSGGEGESHDHGQEGQEGSGGQGSSGSGQGDSEGSEGHDHGEGQGQGQGGSGDGTGSGEGQGQLCEDHSEEEAEYSIGIGGPDGETMDGHMGWGDIPEDLRDILREKVKGMISEGVRKAQMKGSWGSVPASMQEMIQKLLTSEIDWKSILRNFIGRTRSMERDSSIKKINKKAPYVFPGVRRKTIAKLVFFIDQSGSMSDEDVQLALAAAFECSKESEIDVYNFDTSIDLDSHQVWRKASTIEWKRTRCGGTDFECVREFMSERNNRKKFTLACIVTDGYAAEMGQLPGVKFLWLITPGGTLEAIRKGDMVLQMKKEKTAKIKT